PPPTPTDTATVIATPVDTHTPTITPTPSHTPTPRATCAPALTPTVNIMQIDLATNDLVYDRFTDTVYASVPSSAGSMGNTITAISPNTGSIEASVFIGSEQGNLALSDDGQFLYVALNGASTVRRFNIASMTPEIELALGADSFFGFRSAGEIKVLP